MDYLWEILTKPDNMPIAFLVPIMIFFTWLSLREAFKHDRVIKEGRPDDVLKEMHK